MKKALLVLGAVGLLSACAHHGGGHGVHWAYEGHEGPEHWGALSKEYSMCSEGKAQSPINLTGTQAGGLEPLEFHYNEAMHTIVENNGHTIQVNYRAGSYVVVAGKKYELLQFHFHAPSEHQIDGEYKDMVAHLVHKADDGQLAVVAVLFQQGAANAFLEPVWQAMPTSKGKAMVHGSLDLNTLLPSDKGYYNYSGSLTTPPCSEGVNWNVLKTTVMASEEQIAAFTRIFPMSIRPIQPLNGRMIKEL